MKTLRFDLREKEIKVEQERTLRLKVLKFLEKYIN